MFTWIPSQKKYKLYDNLPLVGDRIIKNGVKGIVYQKGYGKEYSFVEFEDGNRAACLFSELNKLELKEIF